MTTKALPDRTDDASLIAPLIGPKTCIVLIQNGVGVEAPYRSRFPDNPIISAVTVVSAEQISPGTIRQNRWTRIHLGPYSNSASFSPTSSGGEKPTVTTNTPKDKSLQTLGTHHACKMDAQFRVGRHLGVAEAAGEDCAGVEGRVDAEFVPADDLEVDFVREDDVFYEAEAGPPVC